MMLSAHETLWRRGVSLLLASASIAAAVILFTWNPSEHSFFPRCFFHWATGWHCPGCGVQRAMHHLLRGRFLTAMHFNTMAVVATPFVAIALLRLTADAWLGVKIPRCKTRAWRTWLILFLVVFFWIGRNCSVYPLTLLAPPGSYSATGVLLDCSQIATQSLQFPDNTNAAIVGNGQDKSMSGAERDFVNAVQIARMRQRRPGGLARLQIPHADESAEPRR